MWAGGIETKEIFNTGIESVGALAMGDLDGDGTLELFVGGRVVAGRWPEGVSSRIYRKQDGRYVEDAANSAVVHGIGMVSGAVWTDLDGDDFPELILGCEWGPLTVFRNERGHLRRWSVPVSFPSQTGVPAGVTTLDQLTGWWNGVTAGDFDGDGRMDLVARNWGSNSKYQRGRTAGHPLRVYYGDWDGDGGVEVIEAYYDSAMQKVVPWRGLNGLALGIPWLRGRFTSYSDYSEASVEEILGERMKQTRVLEANWLETTVFLNRGGQFEAVVLPGEAQFAPAFGVSVGDMDGDGNEDIFLSQNFFGVDKETSPYDAGRGVWLKGNGQGGFESVSGQASGLQVRLAGPSGNPTGVGAVIRLRFGERWGPAREVHAGSGYWSQDSAELVMGTPQTATAVWVRWPGGKTTTTLLPREARSVTVHVDGKVTTP
jgi:hypothetical protein